MGKDNFRNVLTSVSPKTIRFGKFRQRSKQKLEFVAYAQSYYPFNEDFVIHGIIVKTNNNHYLLSLQCNCPQATHNLLCYHEVACAMRLAALRDKIHTLWNTSPSQWHAFVQRLNGGEKPKNKQTTKPAKASQRKKAKKQQQTTKDATIWALVIAPPQHQTDLPSASRLLNAYLWTAHPTFITISASLLNKPIRLRQTIHRTISERLQKNELPKTLFPPDQNTLANIHKPQRFFQTVLQFFQEHNLSEEKGIPRTEFAHFLYTLLNAMTSNDWIPVFLHKQLLPVTEEETKHHRLLIFQPFHDFFLFSQIIAVHLGKDPNGKHFFTFERLLLKISSAFLSKILHPLSSHPKGYTAAYLLSESRLHPHRLIVAHPIFGNKTSNPLTQHLGKIIPEDEFINIIRTLGQKKRDIDNITFMNPDTNLIFKVIESETPTARLYLELHNNKLHARLRFQYGPVEVDFQNQNQYADIIKHNDRFYIVIRDLSAEKRIYRKLTSNKETGLTYARRDRNYLLPVRSSIPPITFLEKHIPQIAKLGIDVFCPEDLIQQLNPTPPQVHITLSKPGSGIDWLQLAGTITWQLPNNQTASIDLIDALNQWKALKDKPEKYLQLADGSRKTIHPTLQQLLEQLELLIQNGNRIHQHNTPLLELLHKASDLVTLHWKTQTTTYLARYEQLTKIQQLPHYPLPKHFHGTLRPYQKEGYYWLRLLYDHQLGGILADDMGLGKTVQVLAFLASLREEKHPEHPDLIVVPRSLVHQWQAEAHHFTPHLRITLYDGSSRQSLNLQNTDLIITTYGLVRNDIHHLKQHTFHCLILDESSAMVKQWTSKTAQALLQINAQFKLALTGTPIENSLNDLWTQLSLLMPGILGTHRVFSKLFLSAEQKIKKGTATRHTTRTLETLRHYIQPLILRRTKDMVLKELPPRTEHTILCTLPPDHQTFYQKTFHHFQQTVRHLLQTKNLHEARMQILNALLRLRQAAIHPKLLDDTYSGASAKFDQLHILLPDIIAEGHKVLIFSSFLKTLELLTTLLKEHGWNYVTLTGQSTPKQRQQAIHTFTTDPNTPLFLLTLKAGGFGLNLTAADYVIILDPWWNPAIERQAADRTHRVGQQKPVFIYRLIAKDTIEEQVLQLQQRKQHLFNLLITERPSSRTWQSLSTDHLHELINLLLSTPQQNTTEKQEENQPELAKP